MKLAAHGRELSNSGVVPSTSPLSESLPDKFGGRAGTDRWATRVPLPDRVVGKLDARLRERRRLVAREGAINRIHLRQEHLISSYTIEYQLVKSQE